MTVEILDYPNIVSLSERLGCNAPTVVAFLPRNFDTAESKDDLVHENSVQTLRTLLREAGIQETRLEKDGERFSYIKESAYFEPVVIFFGISVVSQNPEMVSMALNVVSNYLSDLFKGLGRFKPEQRTAKLDIIVEKSRGKEYKRIHYEGPDSGIRDLTQIVHDIQQSNS